VVLYFQPEKQENNTEQGVKRRRIDNIVAAAAAAADGAIVVAAAAAAAVAVVEWHLLPQELIPSIVAYFDVKTLIEMKQASRSWSQICTNVIHAKRTPRTSKVFETTQELRDAVERLYSRHGGRHRPNIWVAYWTMGRIQPSRLLLHLSIPANVQ
jgi:hypothetical protein